MSAYTHFHPVQPHTRTARQGRPGRTAGFKASPYLMAQSSQLFLSGPQLKFLNPGACVVNPYSKTFWLDLKHWLSLKMHRGASYPKAPAYRSQLEPYLLRRVTMTAKSWEVQNTNEPNGLLRLALRNVRLAHVYSPNVGAAPATFVDHMNIWVSPAWFNAVIPPYGAPLTVTGMLYEYVSSQNTRNIGILPILLEPKGLTPIARQNRRVKRPDSLCPGASA